MSGSRCMFVIMAAALAVVVAAGAVCAADQPKPTVEVKLGLLDVARVQNECQELKDIQAQVDAMRALLTDRLKLRDRHKLLTVQEIDELDKLMQLEKPSDKDKQRMAELGKKSNDLAAQLDSLRTKKDLTDPEKATLAELTDRDTKATSEIAALNAQFAADADKKEKELMDKLTEKIKAEVAALAKEKGYFAVIAKDLVIFGGTDITDDLLARLTAKGK